MSIKYRKLKNNFGAMWSAAAVPTVHYTDYIITKQSGTHHMYLLCASLNILQTTVTNFI